ncbi:PIR Superfamily Protein [Plasmodium ovale wallikeri]|uniref:PIR Superfamily Protein n=1 Tax=Plasmodium ovale wallikeri TaxID=864142 RepID=A0A1A9AFM4_PLAOA|nr:PIR Superfamily Protein [Plasmodium ovale wallikeri]SBT58218.1 PIR Superfamily Protein [Plasmodium ovale wallikeri]
MTKDISENDLPSVKFEKEMKELMNYSALESYVKYKTEVHEIDNWVQNFQTKVEQYLTDSSKDSSFDHDKRCRHFNYLINTTISKITSLSDDIGKQSIWSQKIKESRNKIFHHNIWLNCNESKKYTKNMNILGKFCEDSDFVKEKLRDIQNSNNCQSILNNITTRRGELAIILQEETRKGADYTIIDNKCGINKLDSIFPSITCNSLVEPTSETYAHIQSYNNFGTGKSNDALEIQLKSSLEVLPDGRQGSPAIPGGSETKNDSSSNAMVLVSLPIIGVLALSFFIYKYTPLRTKFHSYYRNKGDIPINQDYEETEQTISNTLNLNDMYSENMQYNISYQKL